MQWNMEYETIALIVEGIVLLYYFSSKHVDNYQNKIYCFFLFTATVYSIINVSVYSPFLYTFFSSSLLLSYLFSFHLLLRTILMFLFFYYIKLVVTNSLSQKTYRATLYIVPLLISVFALLITPATNLVFSISFQNTPGYHFGMLILYASWLFYLILSFFMTLSFRKKLAMHQHLSIYIAICALLLAMLLQYLSPKQDSISLAFATALLLFYFVMENPKLTTDELTSLFNHHAFLEKITHDIKHQNPFYVVMVAMDDFRFINETYGYHYGDLLLKAIAKKLQTTTKHVYRYMGDTFCIVLYEDSDVMTTINRIKSKLDDPWNINSSLCLLSASFCVIAYPEHAETSNELLDFMDFTIQDAKQHGKGNITYGKNSAKDKIKRNNTINYLLKEAIQFDRFEVYYQPVYSMKEKRYVAAEALVRLHDQELGFIPPSEFIPIAEKNGSILSIGLQVFEKVCSFIATHDLKSLHLEYIEVNLSVVQCMQRRLPMEMAAIMKKYNVDPSLINFEITETAVAESSTMLVSSMNELIKLGCRFSLDDFGTGYSNISYVTQLPFDIVKIDKGLIWGAEKNENVNVAIEHLISMFKNLQMKIVAEGIETAKQSEMIAGMGCDYIQGYYYSRPLCQEEFLKTLNQTVEVS